MIRLPAHRRPLLIACLLISTVTASTVLIAVLIGQDGQGALTGAPDDCEAIDIGAYNTLIADEFNEVLLGPPGETTDVHYEDDGSWWCTARPDIDQYCSPESCDADEYGALIYNRLSVAAETDCPDLCGLTTGQLETIGDLNREELDGWDWAVPGHISHTEAPPSPDHQPVYGTLISVYEYENLQIVIVLQVYYYGAPGSSDELMEEFVTLNQETAETIRDRAIDRREAGD